jgi:hypothetical protein
VRGAGRFVGPALWAAVALVTLLALPPLSTSRALAIWVVIVAGIVLVALIRHSRRVGRPEPPRRFEQALRKPKPEQSQTAEFLRMEREIDLGVASAAHSHRRLLPLLRAAASARLASRHGVELERRPDAARALLGEDVWELLRPDRPEPEDRLGPGVPREQIAAVIERVEAL